MTNIALVDDDRNILTSVSIALENEGYTVKTYNDGQAALHAFERRMPDLAVIDVKMPRMDGYELLQRIRKKSATPVIFLTSKDQEIDEVFGLRLGANDYVKKPFSQTLLIERVRSLLRQQEIINNPDGSVYEEDRVIERGHFRLDPLRHILTWKGREVPVTVTEFLVVEALIKRPGYVRTRDQLMDAVYDEKVYVDDRTIDSHIKRLRKRCGWSTSFSKASKRSTASGIGTTWPDGGLVTPPTDRIRRFRVVFCQCVHPRED